MVETQQRDDVGHADDRAVDAGLPLPNGLGRHDNDHMFSFYLATPAGFQIDVGHGARRIVEPWSDDRRYDRISAWATTPSPRPRDPDAVTTQIVLTGTGVPHPRPGRAGAGTLVRYSDVALLIDAGGPRCCDRSRPASSPATCRRCSSCTCTATTSSTCPTWP